MSNRIWSITLLIAWLTDKPIGWYHVWNSEDTIYREVWIGRLSFLLSINY